ncbi:MAG TPA: twin-arginine translocase TatA/TatE family subunit [Polyangiales bacterium]|jgi:sec-independent protein translocase protein TatA
MCSNIGLPELIVILMLLVLVFGASRLPQLGETVGKTIRRFKRGMAQNDDIEVTKLGSPKTRGHEADVSDAELSDDHDDA